MRIADQLRAVSAAAVIALLVSSLLLFWSFSEFAREKEDYRLATAIKVNFLERVSFRDQYFLHREDRLRVQWEKNKEEADRLVQEAMAQFGVKEERKHLDRLYGSTQECEIIFRRIVANTRMLKAATDKRPIYEELDKRLSSQMLLKASAIHDASAALEQVSLSHVEQSYRKLIFITSLFGLTLVVVTVLSSLHINRLFRKRLRQLHDGAKIVAGGNLDYRIPREGGDEFAELALSINTMTERLQAFTQRLEAEINVRKQTEDALRESEFRWKFAIDGSGDGLWDWNAASGTVFFSKRWKEMLGYAEDEIGNGLAEWEQRLHPDDKVAALAMVQDYLDGKIPVYANEHRIRCKDGGYKWILSRGMVVSRDKDGKPSRLIGTHTDTTERKQAEDGLRLAASVFGHALEAILIADAGGNIVDVNETFTRITGFTREDAVGRNPRFLKSGRHDEAFYAAMWRELIQNGHWRGEIWNRRKGGEIYAELLNISAVRDAQGNTRQYVALFSDITALKEHEHQLERIAHYDALTALPNRVLLSDRLHQGMTQALRHRKRMAVAYIDLDGFKAVNDHHGHEAGDQLLMALSTRMKQTLRAGDTLARLGGDEFVAVLLDLCDIEDSVPMLTRLLAAAAQPVPVGDLVLQVSASVGVAFYPQTEDTDADQLLRQADQSMYQAKLAGKNRYHIFDADQDRNVRIHHESLEHIRLALAAREFVLHYQPKIDMRRGRVIGVEALIRWRHPEQGLLPPAAFLPAIEDHPLAVELGEWVIDTALTQIECWRDAGLDIPVSVNVGARQLQQPDFVDRLRILLAAHPKVMPGCFEIEVLETSALEDLAHVSQVIEACRGIGVPFALDDFGTGYSSLTYLKRLPVTQLKIDQSFVRDMLVDPEDLAILEGVLGLATAFRRQAIAEGVETIEHAALLLQLGCELAQGYVFARPMPGQDLPGWLAAWRPDPAWANIVSLSRDDLPLLFASVEHRAWIATLGSHLQGQHEEPPPLDRHQCHFGKWLDNEGRARYGARPSFAAIEVLHRQVHELAVELCGVKTFGKHPEPLARLAELHDLRDRLIEQLSALTHEVGIHWNMAEPIDRDQHAQRSRS